MLHYVIISPYEDVAGHDRAVTGAGICWMINDECIASLLCS